MSKQGKIIKMNNSRFEKKCFQNIFHNFTQNNF